MDREFKQFQKIYYGWWIVVASSAMTTYNAGIMFYGFTAFFTPIVSEFGWSRASTSFAFSLQRLEGGITAPLVGFLIDKLGPRNLNLFAVTVFGLGFILLSRINSLLSFYLVFVLISVGQSAGFFSVGTASVANWFIRKRGKAMGFLTGGVCVAGSMVPIVVWLINSCGWRTSLVILGIGMWIIGIPLSLVLRQRPEQIGLLPDGDILPVSGSEPAASVEKKDRDNPSPTVATSTFSGETDFTALEALKTGSFWLLALGASISGMAMSALFVHIMPYLESVGISRDRAGFVVTFVLFFSAFGRIGLGWLSDYVDKRYVFSIALALQVFGLLIFANISTLWHVIPFIVLFSPGYGAMIPIRPAVQGEYFGRTHFGTIQGISMSISTATAMIGPPLAGWIWDITGSYRPAFIIFTVTTAVGIPLILAARPPTRKSMPGS